MAERKPRGRPRSEDIPTRARYDCLLASVAHRLIFWGFSTNDVFAAIADVNSNYPKLGAESIKKLYRKWLKTPWESSGPAWINRSDFSKESLEERSPRQIGGHRYQLKTLARVLLENDGHMPIVRYEGMTKNEFDESGLPSKWWQFLQERPVYEDIERSIYFGDLELTAGGGARLNERRKLMPRIKKTG